jgi:hypothetical protein
LKAPHTEGQTLVLRGLDHEAHNRVVRVSLVSGMAVRKTYDRRLGGSASTWVFWEDHEKLTVESLRVSYENHCGGHLGSRSLENV